MKFGIRMVGWLILGMILSSVGLHLMDWQFWAILAATGIIAGVTD